MANASEVVASKGSNTIAAHTHGKLCAPRKLSSKLTAGCKIEHPRSSQIQSSPSRSRTDLIQLHLNSRTWLNFIHFR